MNFPIEYDLYFEHDLLNIIRQLHDISTGIGGDPSSNDFEMARWLQWKLSVWKDKTISPSYPESDKFANSIKALAESALEEFKARCCKGIYENECSIK